MGPPAKVFIVHKARKVIVKVKSADLIKKHLDFALIGKFVEQ